MLHRLISPCLFTYRFKLYNHVSVANSAFYVLFYETTFLAFDLVIVRAKKTNFGRSIRNMDC